MLVTVLKSKIHRAKVTHINLDYSGSFGIDKDIMAKVGLVPYEKILISNMNTGDRLETYCIEEPAGSMKFALYGAAARLGMPGDIVVVMSFAQLTPEELSKHKPVVVNLN